MSAEVKRIYPESKTGLINWIEENFHEIQEFVVSFRLKDGTTMTTYDCYSYFNALGMCMMSIDTVQQLGAMGEFKPKEEE